MNSIVYNGCTEPEGMELDWHEYFGKCSECGDESCTFISYERADGGAVNKYKISNCAKCGYFQNTGHL